MCKLQRTEANVGRMRILMLSAQIEDCVRLIELNVTSETLAILKMDFGEHAMKKSSVFASVQGRTKRCANYKERRQIWTE